RALPVSQSGVVRARGASMKSVIPAATLAGAIILGLSACVYVPPPPPPLGLPPPPIAAPPPYAMPAPLPPPVAYRRCALGWHWVPGHHNRAGRWIRPHCAPNR